MKIFIASDHAGLDRKQQIINYLKKILPHAELKDEGPYSTESVDYPDFVHPVCKAIENDEAAMGILLCGTANGVAMTANKHSKIRAGLCWQPEIAALTRQHNDANILCIPARFVSRELALEMVDTFMETTFEGGRHQKRVAKIANM